MATTDAPACDGDCESCACKDDRPRFGIDHQTAVPDDNDGTGADRRSESLYVVMVRPDWSNDHVCLVRAHDANEAEITVSGRYDGLEGHIVSHGKLSEYTSIARSEGIAVIDR